MRNFSGKTYWLIGASEGLGRALAKRLHAEGAHVVVSARNKARLDELVSELDDRSTAVACDVGDLNSLSQAADQIGHMDGVVYLAGVYWPMPATEIDPDDLEAMVDINFTGAARAVGVAVPRLLEQNDGHIVIVGSLSGFRGLPNALGYAASKAGTMVLAESLYADLKNTSVDVQLINPGFIETRLTDKNDFKMPFIMPPEKAADIMFSHMSGNRFKRSFPTMFSWLFRGSQFLPDWMYYRLFS